MNTLAGSVQISSNYRFQNVKLNGSILCVIQVFVPGLRQRCSQRVRMLTTIIQKFTVRLLVVESHIQILPCLTCAVDTWISLITIVMVDL